MFGFPEDISLHGHVVDDLFSLAFWLTLTAFAAVLVALGTMVLRFRARPGKNARYMTGESRGALLLTLSLALLVFFGIDINLAYHDEHSFAILIGSPPIPQDAFVVQVLATQFEWNFRYCGPDGEFGTGDDATTVNELHVPVNRPVLFQMRSKDVIHSFFLPLARVKQDVLPGMTTSLYFQPVKTGRFEVACAELCGMGHYRMRAIMFVEDEDDVNEWMIEENEEYGIDTDLWALWTAGPGAG